MNKKNESTFTFRDPDLEAQRSSHGGGGSDASSLCTDDPHKTTTLHTSTEAREEPPPLLPRNSHISQDDRSEENAAGDTAQPQSGWRPWKLDEPYRTKVPKDEKAMEKWVKAMKESDDGMCQGWKDQIDTLIIFAGLFSATVTAFTVESYQWLYETPAETLARLQLRALLNATHDPAMDRLAPSTFNISASSVLINALWFASLTIALTAVVVSILCKQWLHEYQRYDNFTTEESFLIHGLRNRGLRAWRVPGIIASLPVLLQMALVLFLIGLLVLLWPLQTIVASITTAIVGLTFLFLGVTTILPAIQYIYPTFDTQCAYKSSQSWSFFFISAFWLFDFSMFTNWTIFDRWEVTCVSNGKGHTLSRVYELLSNSLDAFQSIYSCIADTSMNPTIDADLTLLSDFVDGLEASRRDQIIKAISQTMDVDSSKGSEENQRIGQLRGYIHNNRRWWGRLKPVLNEPVFFWSSFEKCPSPSWAYHRRIQAAFSQLLETDIHIANPVIFNRCIEHWVRCLNGLNNNMDIPKEDPTTINSLWEGISWRTARGRQAHIQWDPDITSHLVEMFSHVLKTDRFCFNAQSFLSNAYAGFMKSYHQHKFNPPPFTLLKDIQDWVSRTPESDLRTKVQDASSVMYNLVGRLEVGLLDEHSQTSDVEKTYLRSFGQFFVDFFEREDVLKVCRETGLAEAHIGRVLGVLRNDLARDPPTSS